MTISELFETLEELVNDNKGDLPVLIAHQPNYPLQTEVGRVFFHEDGESSAFYIGEASFHSNTSPYPPEEVNEELGYK